MIVVNVEQGSDAWFSARLGRPTGSVYADVLAKGRDGGKSVTRQKLIVKLALELVTGKPFLEDAWRIPPKAPARVSTPWHARSQVASACAEAHHYLPSP